MKEKVAKIYDSVKEWTEDNIYAIIGGSGTLLGVAITGISVKFFADYMKNIRLQNKLLEKMING